MEEQSHEERFVSWVTSLSLQEMAACSMARALLVDSFSHISSKFDIEDKSMEVSKFYASKYNADSLKIPSSIKETIAISLNKVSRCLLDWIFHMENDLFPGQLTAYRIARFDPKWCVWYPSGEIDYRKTAMNMLTSPRLSEIQRFAIMCKYCFEEQIVKFELNSLPTGFILVKNSLFYWDGLMFYWMNRLKNEPLHVFNLIDEHMALNTSIWNLEAFKYFWRRLGNNYQILLASLDRMRQFQYPGHLGLCGVLKELLHMMSRDQQISLLCEIPEKIISIFCHDDRSNFPRTVFWAWRNCKDFMTTGQFVDTIEELFFSPTSEFQEERVLALIELWQTAPDHLRNVAQERLRNKIDSILPCRSNPFNVTETTISSKGEPGRLLLEFLCIFFSSENENFRRSTMMKNAGFVAESDIRYTSELIDVCFPNANDRLNFKSLVAMSYDLKVCCRFMLIDGEFDELHRKLQYYFPDIVFRQQFQREIIEWLITANFSFFTDGFRKWYQLYCFIYEAYANDVALALEKMKRIWLELGVTLTYGDANICEALDEFIRIAITMFTRKDLVKFKQNLMKLIRQRYFNSRFRHRNFRGFHEIIFSKLIPWCLENEGPIGQFKNGSLPVDRIFKALIRAIDRFLDRKVDFDYRTFSQFDGCLKWYLGSDEETKKYKLKKINALVDLRRFKAKLRRNIATKGSGRVIVALYWFFDGDETAIGEFISNRPHFFLVAEA